MLDHLRQLIFGHSPVAPAQRLRMTPERFQAALYAAHAECRAQDADNRAAMRQARHNRIIVCQGR